MSLRALSKNAVAVFALAMGCGSSASNGGDRAHETGSGGEVTETADPRHLCEGLCTTGQTCPRASIEWRCACEHVPDVNCGGAERDLGPGRWAWSCVPIDPRTDRGDGCPYAAPTADSTCDGSPQCRYSSGCGWDGTTASCVSGRWVLEEFHLPPPP